MSISAERNSRATVSNAKEILLELKNFNDISRIIKRNLISDSTMYYLENLFSHQRNNPTLSFNIALDVILKNIICIFL